MLAIFSIVTVLLLDSFQCGSAQQCFSSLDCRGEELEELPASYSGCCVSGGGLSFQTSRRRPCTNCFTEEGFTTEGSSFLAGFFGNFDPRLSIHQISKVRFSINPTTRLQSTVFVEALGERKTIAAPSEVEFNSRQLNLKSPSERDKGMLIFSKDSDSLSVIALAEEFQSSDAFKVLPCIKLPSDTYEYFTVSVPITQIPIQIEEDYADYYEDYELGFEDIEGNSAIVIRGVARNFERGFPRCGHASAREKFLGATPTSRPHPPNYNQSSTI